MSPTLDLLTPTRLSWTMGIVLFTLALRFWQKLHYNRSLVKGLPGPPHSYLWGSILSMNEVLSKLPARVAPQNFPHILKARFDLGDYFALDPWPFGPPMLIVMDPEMAAQFTVKPSAPKHYYVDEFMQNFGGPSNLVSAEGAVWKKWRQVFNPGFSATHLMTQVSAIVDEVAIFSDIMLEHAEKNDLFRMEPATTKLAIDIIGKVVLATNLRSQTEPYNELVSAFNSQTRWQPVGVQYNPWEAIDIRIPFVQAWNNYRMDRFLGHCLDARIASRTTSTPREKHVVDLAYEAYLHETHTTHDPTTRLPPDFRRAAIANAKTFVFAGHDTTSATLSYTYYYLSQHPPILSRLRSELTSVLGPRATTPATLKSNPTLLNALPYTTAILRETLRLQPPASSMRAGTPDITLTDPKTSTQIPTANLMLWPVDVALHRNPAYWPSPNEFNPSRFISHDPLAPPNQPYSNNASNPAFVPFSRGPRNCIGQELAMIEAKIILAMTVRAWDFEACFDRGSLEKLKGDGSGYASEWGGVQDCGGEVAYQVQRGSAKPREGMPCRLRVRGEGGGVMDAGGV